MWRSAGGGAEAEESSVEPLCFAEERERNDERTKRRKEWVGLCGFGPINRLIQRTDIREGKEKKMGG